MTRTYVVTGAVSGIGAATAALLSEQGHRVVGFDRHNADVNVDLGTDRGRGRLVEEVDRRCDGRIDALIAAAGTVQQGETDIRVNYFGAVATLERLRPLLARSAAPRAVAVASYAVLGPVHDELVAKCLSGDEEGAVGVELDDPAGFVTYASTKRALARWVRRQAPTAEWAGCGIALNAVAPGVIRTPMTAGLLANPASADALLQIVPMPFGGIGEPSAVAEMLAFLTSERSQSTTGQTVFVDGGGDCVVRGDDVF